MARTDHGGEKGFTLIEVMIVLAILGILITIGITTYMSTIDRIKLQSDVRAVNGTLQLARMRAISSGISHGVAFWRRDSNNAGNKPDAYFVFVDCNSDLIYTDNNTEPADNTPITSWDMCKSALGHDPILKGEVIHPLTSGIYFTTIFDSKSNGTAKNGAPLEFVTFNSLGQAMWGMSLADGYIFLQNHHLRDGAFDKAGIRVYGASGVTDLVPMGRGGSFP